MPGSWISIKISCGCSSRASVRPASASVALITEWPADSSRKTASVMLAGLSSTIRTLAISGDQPAPGHGSPDLCGKAVGVETGLFHDGRDIAGQLRAVLRRDVLGRDDDNRDTSGVGLRLERFHHVKAV